MENERKTVTVMVTLYCRDHHGSKTAPCEKCRDLITYAHKRLGACPFQEEKPTCGHCRIHCYKSEARTTMQEVMRYSGPRMLLRHPLLAIRHMRDSCRKSPSLPEKNRPKKNS